ncbi:MAG: AMP-binding protein [Pseudomonadales bacterium]|nr:AMP-binding protein [Pseudomonadales bacterium]MBP9035887.1 AMP-binding protein [Pseudomonadales bacterium]
MQTVADIFLARRADPDPALYFEDRHWSGAAVFGECAARAAWLLAGRPAGAFHVGVLLDNTPEHLFWIGACALAGATLVELNSTRRGADLARDLTHTQCGFLVTETRYREQLDAAPAHALGARLQVTDDASFAGTIARFRDAQPGTPALDPVAPFCLIFTSGTSGAPKAVIYSHARVLRNSAMLVERQQMSRRDVSYVPMPLFHSSGLLMGLLPPLIAGGAAVLRRRFSASGFLADVRRYGVTMFCYVGKPLAYILATPERADDADNTLRAAFGSEASDVDIATFARRFGCTVIDSYGSSEGCITVLRTPQTPRGSLGLGVSPSIVVLNPDTGQECPRARFDAGGVLRNGNEAIGELVNLQGGELFEGYWNNPAAAGERVRGRSYWSGDLAYRDEAGFFYFAGRSSEWLRVDGENLSAIQIEQVLARHPLVSAAAVYGVPDPLVGDRVMAALQLVPGAALDMTQFEAFLDQQPDFGSKWKPSFVRIVAQLPLTATNKVLKRELKRQAWDCGDPVWFCDTRDRGYRLLGAAERAALAPVLAAREHPAPHRS